MHLRIIWAIVRKDALDIWVNKTTLVGLVYPIIMSLVFFMLSHLIGNTGTELIIYNPGNSSIAQVVVNAFPNPKVTQAVSATQVKEYFGNSSATKKLQYSIGLVLPIDLDESLRKGAKPVILLFVDGTAISTQTQGFLQSSIINSARTIADPQPPITVQTVFINRPSTTSITQLIGQIYTPIVLLLSLIIGTTFIPTLLIEEKEKKTLRMLLVTPATFRDILLGKLLIVLFFQLIITGVALAIQGGFTGNVVLVCFYVLLGALFSMALGLLFGSVFNTVGAAGTVAGFVSIFYILGGLFVGQLGQRLGNAAIVTITRILPTYYLAEGVINASQNLGTWTTNLLDIGVVLGSTVLLLVISAWVLNKQSSVLALV